MMENFCIMKRNKNVEHKNIPSEKKMSNHSLYDNNNTKL
jgi:hypothetical protein